MKLCLQGCFSMSYFLKIKQKGNADNTNVDCKAGNICLMSYPLCYAYN